MRVQLGSGIHLTETGDVLDSPQEVGDARVRIERTKLLNLDERMDVLRRILQEHGWQPTPAHAMQTRDALISLGYEPMMFHAAARILAIKHKQRKP